MKYDIMSESKRKPHVKNISIEQNQNTTYEHVCDAVKNGAYREIYNIKDSYWKKSLQ